MEDRATYQTKNLRPAQDAALDDLRRFGVPDGVLEAIRQEILSLSNLDLLEKVIELARTPGNWAFDVAKEELNRRLTPWFKEVRR